MSDRSTQFWDTHRLSNEKRVAVSLVDAYDLYVNPNKDETGNAVAIVREVSEILSQAMKQVIRWKTMAQAQETLSEIGENLNAKLVPAMKDEKRKKADIGGLLVYLACLFFQGSSESINRAPTVYEQLPSTEIPVRIPTMIHLKQTIAGPRAQTIVAVTISAVITYSAVQLGSAMTKKPFPPTPTNLLTALLAFAAIATIIRFFFPGQVKQQS